MSFFKKVFAAIFFSTFLVSTSLIWISHYFISRRATADYVTRYQNFSRALGRNLTQMETDTESVMLNALHVLDEEERRRGALSNSQLKSLAADLNVSHIFETDINGTFIRSTNEDPKLIPNLYSFCTEYKTFAQSADRKQFRVTPIIPPFPEPVPYKFLFLKNFSGTRLLEAGTRVTYLGQAF